MNPVITMDQKQRNKLVLAIKRCIAAKFTSSDWDELAYITEGHDVINNHHRLLRSLLFGDDDYEGHIFGVVEELIDKNPSNLQAIIDYIQLPAWLSEHHPKDYYEIYGHTQALLDGAAHTAITNSFELNQHIVRIRQAVETDPELAVGSIKEMIESVLKTILEANGEIPGKDDLNQLLKRTQKVIKLDPNELDPNTRGVDIVKRTLSNLSQVVIGIDELRNIYGTGHGRTKRSGISSRHARLVVGAGAALAIFLMETFEYHQKKT